MGKLSNLVLSSLLLFGSISKAENLDNSSLEKVLQEKVRRSMVDLQSFIYINGDSKFSESFGEGFLVNERYLITNMHVTADKIMEKEDGDDFKILCVPKFIISYSKESPFRAWLVKSDKKNDYAIYELMEDDAERIRKEGRYLKINPSAHKGEKVFWFRNNNGKPLFCTSGEIININYHNRYTGNNILTTNTALYGESGSPLVNKYGEVIGVIKEIRRKRIEAGWLLCGTIAVNINLIDKEIRDYEKRKSRDYNR